MAKARAEARRLGSCRPSAPRFMRAFAPLRPAPAAHPQKRTQSAPVLILGANGGYVALGCLTRLDLGAAPRLTVEKFASPLACLAILKVCM